MGSVHGHSVLLLWAYGGTTHHVDVDVDVEEDCSPHNSREAKRRRGQRPNIPFKGISQWPNFFQLGPTS
jgi:hypothetical protein